MFGKSRELMACQNDVYMVHEHSEGIHTLDFPCSGACAHSRIHSKDSLYPLRNNLTFQTFEYQKGVRPYPNFWALSMGRGEHGNQHPLLDIGPNTSKVRGAVILQP